MPQGWREVRAGSSVARRYGLQPNSSFQPTRVIRAILQRGSGRLPFPLNHIYTSLSHAAETWSLGRKSDRSPLLPATLRQLYNYEKERVFNGHA